MLFRGAIGRGRWSSAFAWTTLGVFLLLGLPLFLCLPLWADVTLYDLAARAVLRGGVHYRDIFDTNLPGMVWLHLAVRTLLGWRSEAIRAVDVLIVAGIVGLLVRGLRREGVPHSLPVWTALALFAFYLSTGECSHCQRDVWMLLPALGALQLRHRQVSRLTDPRETAGKVWLGGLAEGLCWGAACWIKPHVAVPALACWLVGIACVQRHSVVRGRCLVDAAGLLTGGFVLAGVGVAWLWQSGAWPHFWEVFLDWNREYYAQSTGFVQHTRDVFKRFRPWSRIHYAALLVALVHLGRLGMFSSADTAQPARSRRALLAGFYLAWLLQAAYLQKGHDYVLAPPVLLALTVVADQVGPLVSRQGDMETRRHGDKEGSRFWSPCLLVSLSPCLLRVALAGIAVYLAACHPLLQPQRLALWNHCWREQSTAAIRDRLKLTAVPATVHWGDLEQVADYLRRQGVGPGEVTCYNNFTHPLYLDLDLQPSTPFLHFDTLLTIFPRHREAIRQHLSGGRQRFVVSDLDAVRVQGPLLESSDGSLTLPAGFPRDHAHLYPWTEPILFRAGSYLVHAVTGPAGPLASETSHKPVGKR